MKATSVLYCVLIQVDLKPVYALALCLYVKRRDNNRRYLRNGITCRGIYYFFASKCPNCYICVDRRGEDTHGLKF